MLERPPDGLVKNAWWFFVCINAQVDDSGTVINGVVNGFG